MIGRYFAMDRDKRWDRVKLAYDAIVHGQSASSRRARPASTPSTPPTRATRTTSSSSRRSSATREATVRSGDAIICFNFRPDRMREIVAAFGETTFETYDGDGFERGDAPDDLDDRDDDRVPRRLALLRRLPARPPDA